MKGTSVCALFIKCAIVLLTLGGYSKVMGVTGGNQ